jgi:hypothetical protein
VYDSDAKRRIDGHGAVVQYNGARHWHQAEAALRGIWRRLLGEGRRADARAFKRRGDE